MIPPNSEPICFSASVLSIADWSATIVHTSSPSAQ
jgi:hypothetical protein